MSMLTFRGSNFFRQRLVLSTLSGKPIQIKNIRDTEDEPGIKGYELSLLQLLQLISVGSGFDINETGTVVKYKPGLLCGGEWQHNCCVERGIGYYLEVLLCLAPFSKEPLHITLRGVTHNHIDHSVDALKHSSLPVLKKFIFNNEKLDLKIHSCGLPPDGGGAVEFFCPVVDTIRPVKCLQQGKIKKIRGYAFSVRVSPAICNSIVDSAKSFLMKALPDVYIYTNPYKKENSGKSPGFGLVLIAESTTGVFYSAEAMSKPTGSGDDFVTPEDVAKDACFKLFEEIYIGGCVDTKNQSLACLFMALGPSDVSKFKMGPLSPYTVQFLRHIEDFLQLRMKLESTKEEHLRLGTHKNIVTCVGIGFSNISRRVV